MENLVKKRIVKLLRHYAPKPSPEMVMFHRDYQKDTPPRSGIWEAVGAEEVSSKDPLFTLRCIGQFGPSEHKIGETLKMRQGLLVLLFDRIEMTRTPIN